jgi:hypothetical protein
VRLFQPRLLVTALEYLEKWNSLFCVRFSNSSAGRGEDSDVLSSSSSDCSAREVIYKPICNFFLYCLLKIMNRSVDFSLKESIEPLISSEVSVLLMSPSRHRITHMGFIRPSLCYSPSTEL